MKVFRKTFRHDNELDFHYQAKLVAFVAFCRRCRILSPTLYIYICVCVCVGVYWCVCVLIGVSGQKCVYEAR